MNIIDSKGRLFGKLSILDLGAALVILLVIIGIFFVPGTSGSLAQVSTKPIEVDVVVRGLNVKNPDELLQEMQEAGKTNIIIRNQPSGSVEIKEVELLERQVIIPQPDGSVKVIPEPRTAADSFSTDMVITLAGKAQITDDVAVLGKNQIKIGKTVELDGQSYNFNGSVIGVRIID
ncbi:MAG: DUF4330 domain-containing protein [Cyanobacteria bacterium SBLK]|nr:DUF4330 domain-containing protein [Cyanobacteria bacterium SBLK]